MLNVVRNREIIAIANPTAGSNLRKEKMTSWSSRLPANTQLHVTSSSSHAEELAYHASQQGYAMVIAVGGDGTVHSVLNGIMRNRENGASMGVVAMGSANDYAKSLRAYRTRHPSESTLVDIGRLRWADQVRYFANVVGVGLSSRVARYAESLRGWPARFRYSLAVLRCLRAGLSAETMEVMIDNPDRGENVEGYTQDTLLMMSIGIGTREGSFEMAAQARFDDGLFNTLQVGKLSRWDMLYYFPGVLRGQMPNTDPRIRQDVCREVRLRCQRPIGLHLDGELPIVASDGIRECTLDILPRHLSVHVL